MIKKNQHVVPKFILKKFTNPTMNNQFYAYNCMHNNISKKVPSNVCSYPCTYESILDNHNKQNILENEIASLESEYAQYINKLINSINQNKPIKFNYAILYKFLKLQQFRTYKGRELFALTYIFYMHNSLYKKINLKEINGTILRQRFNETFTNIADLSIFLDNFYITANQPKCFILLNNTNEKFLISDEPVVFCELHNNKVLFAFPVSPTICITEILDISKSKFIEPKKKIRTVSKSLVTQINTEEIHNAVFWIISQEEFSSKYLDIIHKIKEKPL